MSTKDLFRITEGDAVYSFTSSNEDEPRDIDFLMESGDTLSLESGEGLILEELEIFEARIVGRGEFKDTSNFLKDTVDLSFQIRDPLALHFLQSPIDYAARIECFSLDEAGVLRNEWRGTLTDVKPNSRGECKLTFNSLFASNRTAGTRPVFQRNCRHNVYGPACGVVFDNFKVAANVTGLSSTGLVITCAEAALKPSGYYNAGVIVMPDGTKRYIRSHVGNQLTLIRYSPSLVEAWNESGATTVPVFIAPGCSQNYNWCFETFGNQKRYGGFLNIPLNDPNSSAIV